MLYRSTERCGRGRTSITAQRVGEVISSAPLLAWEERQNGTGPGSVETPLTERERERLRDAVRKSQVEV